jgi:HlyD family secretion protein
VTQAQRQQAEQQRKLVETGPRRERIVGQRAVVAQAEAVLRQADAALANAVIRAPFDGVVTVRDREPGETVGPGAPVLTVMNLKDRWVRIYIREDRIGAVHVGQSASISADTYPDKRYAGDVAFIASEAEFTPRNVQTTEERVKLVYAVKVRVTGDSTFELKPGMPADVSLTPVPSPPR